MSKRDANKGGRALARVLTQVIEGSQRWEEAADRISSLGWEADDALQAALATLGEAVGRGGVGPALLAGAPLPVVEATVQALLHRQDAASLSALAGSGAPKPTRKAAAAALHRLQREGVAISAEPEAAGLFKLTAEPPIALASSHDDTGRRLLAFHIPTERVNWSILLGEDGVFDAAAQEGSEGTLLEDAADFTAQTRLAQVRIPLAHGIHLLEQGIAAAREAGRPAELESLQLLQELKRFAAPQDMIPPEARDAAPIRGEDPQPRVSNLIFQREVLAWELPPARLDAAMKAMMEIGQSSLIVSENAEAERARRANQAATAEAFDEATRLRMAGRLSELSLLLANSGRGALVETAGGSANALRDLSIPAEEIPFAREFFMVALMKAMEAMGHMPRIHGDPEPEEPEDTAAEEPLIVPGR